MACPNQKPGWNWPRFGLVLGMTVATALSGGAAPLRAEQPDPFEELRLRIEQVERENQKLKEELDQTKSDLVIFSAPQRVPPSPPAPEYGRVGGAVQNLVDTAKGMAGNPSLVPLPQYTPSTPPPAGPKYPTVRVTGFFQADAVWVTQSPDNRIAIAGGTGGSPIGDAQDGADFRRARLAATGNAYKNVGYMLEMDFAFPGRPTFMDLFLDVRELPALGTVRVGQWRQPFSMVALTSVREIWFLERALPFAFTPFRQIGAGFFNSNEDLGLTYAASVFRYPTGPFGGNVGDSGGYGFMGRTTLLAIEYDNNTNVHVGFGYSFVDPSNDLLRIRSTPELFIGETVASLPAGIPTNLPAFVDTGDIPTQNFNLFGAELAGSWGSWTAMSELMVMRSNQISGPNLNFWGAYAQVAYVLTGEVHPYNKKSGVFTRVVPEHPFNPVCGDWGAWEVAGRWSTIDLNSNNVLGNQLTDLTFGLNWYLNPNTKFQFNYVHAMLNSFNVGKSSADFFALRAQVDF